MRHTFVEVQNFKGINNIRLDFDAHPRSHVYTLVGLNESGKTTILEAIHFFRPRVNGEKIVPQTILGYSDRDPREYIPIAKRSNFNERIVIEVGYEPDDADQAKIREYLHRELNFELTQDIENFSITQAHAFQNSQLAVVQPMPSWTLHFWGRYLPAPGARRKTKPEENLRGDDWQKAVKFIKTLLPSVLYFPNFLFEFPDKIYLERPAGDTEKDIFYRSVLQDVLDAIGGEIDLATHVTLRTKSEDEFERQALESVLHDMSNHITKTVLDNWNRIFKRPPGTKEISVQPGRDSEGIFLRLRIKDKGGVYAISERSLGFRWFFAFLLFTQYRGQRGARQSMCCSCLTSPLLTCIPQPRPSY